MLNSLLIPDLMLPEIEEEDRDVKLKYMVSYPILTVRPLSWIDALNPLIQSVLYYQSEYKYTTFKKRIKTKKGYIWIVSVRHIKRIPRKLKKQIKKNYDKRRNNRNSI